MSAVQWLPVGSDSIADARWQALNVAQWLARIANSYGAFERAHSHPALRWRQDGSIATSEFERQFAVELHLADLSMTFSEAGNPVPHELDVEERSPAQVEAWILIELLHRGIDRDRFSLALPYEVTDTDLISGDAFDYSPESCRAELAQLTNWYRNAGAALARLANKAGATTEVVCLPKNLHLAVFLPVHTGTTSRTLRVGFAPGDATIPEPYFYLSAEDSTADAEPKVVLTASEIVASDDPAATVDALLDEAVTSSRHQFMN